MDISLTDVVTYTKAIQNLNKNFITTINYELSKIDNLLAEMESLAELNSQPIFQRVVSKLTGNGSGIAEGGALNH